MGKTSAAQADPYYQERFAIAGDLEEVFHEIGRESGYSKARRWYWRQCVNSFPEYLLYLLSWGIVLFRNYLKTALRNIARQKTHSLVNILGLSLALASCILIYLFIADELSYDRFHEKADAIYAVVCRNEFHDESVVVGTAAMGPVMEEYFPEIEHAVRMNTMNQATVRYKDKIFNEYPVFTDPTFFNVFSFPLIYGDPETVLLSKNSVVLTRKAAHKYFGNARPIGRTLAMIFGELKKEFIVSGISQDVPENSTIEFDILLNVNNLSDIRGPDYLTGWGWFDTEIYVLLRESSTPDKINRRFPLFVKQYFQKTLEQMRSSGSWKGEGDVISFSLQNIKSLHLNTVLRGVGAADIKRSAILAGIAFLILSIACINFINLSIGRASGRAREIGMRKILGAYRKQLIHQFWTESLVLTFLAMLAGLLIAFLFLPVFNQFAVKNLNMDSFLKTINLLVFSIILITVGTVSGSFPALVMSGFHPVEILKGKLKIGRKTLLTKSLIVVQFSLSIFLMIATLTMARQIKSMQQKGLGFDKEGVVEDYHFRSLQHEIKPIILHIDPSYTVSNLLVRISLENTSETIKLLEETWKEIQPDKPFLFSFVDEEIEAAYKRQKRWSAIVRHSSILAVLITCMGIFALTSLTISRRVKEIGIRKVLGAGIIQIANMIYKEFILLVVIANVIAWPAAYYVMRRWLQGFAYRVAMDPGLFFLAGFLTLIVTLATVSYLAVKAALANPVDSLRTE